jgi:benzoylformate decarboxylase
VTTVREAAHEVLRSVGMTRVFGNPGSSELPFLKDFPADFQYVLGLHERAAAGMALGYAIGTGNAAFVNLHSVASVGNGLSAIIDAYRGQIPVVFTTGQQDRRHLLAEPFLVSRAVDCVTPYVKWACEPLRAEDVPSAIARGYHLAMQPPRGPVLLSIPMDDWNKPCARVITRKVTQTVYADEAALKQVVRAMDESRKLALVAGAQIEEDGAWHHVIALAEQLNADVFGEPIPARCAFPRSHRLFRAGLLPAQKPLAEQLAPYDTVVVIGAPVFFYYAYVPGDPIRPGTKLFQLTNAPNDAAAALAGMSVVGNIAAAVKYLVANAKASSGNGATATDDFLTVRAPEPKAEYPMTTSYLFNVLNKVMPRGAIIAEECPSSKGDLDKYLRLDEPGSFYSSHSGVLGFGLPLAIGLQMAKPERRVVCPIGDGSLQYTVQALWSAVKYKAPVVFVVVRNRNYSALRGFRDFTQVGKNVPGIDIEGLDEVKIAQGYGLAAREVDRPEELEPALREAFTANEPRLVCVNVRPGGEKTMEMDQSVNPPNYG